MQTRLCPPSEPSCLGAAPEARIGRPAAQGCIVRQDVLLVSTCLPAGTAELPRGPKVEGPGGKVPGKQRGQEGRRNSGNKGGSGNATGKHTRVIIAYTCRPQPRHQTPVDGQLLWWLLATPKCPKSMTTTLISAITENYLCNHLLNTCHPTPVWGEAFLGRVL